MNKKTNREKPVTLKAGITKAKRRYAGGGWGNEEMININNSMVKKLLYN